MIPHNASSMNNYNFLTAVKYLFENKECEMLKFY